MGGCSRDTGIFIQAETLLHCCMTFLGEFTVQFFTEIARSGANKTSDLKMSEIKFCELVLLTNKVRAAFPFFSL